MFDINTIITNAINEAVNARISELLQQQDLDPRLCDIEKRVAALENAYVKSDIEKRIAALENIPNVASLDKHILAVEQQVDALKHDLNHSDQHIAAQYTDVITRLGVLEDAHDGDSLDRRIKEVEGRLDDLCNEVNDLENNLSDHVGDDDVHVEDGSSPDTDAIREAVQDILSEARLNIRF